MRQYRLQILGLTCAALALTAAPALAQSSGLGSSSVGGGLGSSSFGGGGLGGSSLGSGGFGASGSSFGMSGTGFGTGSSGGNTFTGGTSGTAGTGVGTATGGRAGAARVGGTSFLGPYYYNPLALGLTTGSTTTAFGAPMYTLTTNTTGTASVNTQNAMPSGFGVGVGIRRLPAYATTLKFAVPPPPPPARVRVDLQDMLAQTTQLDPRDSVRILIDGTAVVLRGRVVDDDERRLVENMVLLTPGVNQVRNELAVGGSAP